MRIAVLSSRFPPVYAGGAETAAYNLSKNLASQGHDVHVVTRRQESTANDGFMVHQVRHISRPQRMRYLTTVFFMARETVRIRPDVIYCQTLYSESLAGIIAGRILGVPVVTRSVGEIYVTSSFFDRLVMKFVIRKSSLVLALTGHMEREVRKIFRKARVGVLPEGVDYDFFRNYPERGRSPNTVLFVGRLMHLKCVDCLLKAFSIVQKEIPGAGLNILGDGEQAGELKSLARDLGLKNANFMGSVGRDEVARQMKSSSIFVLPSISEGFPLVIPEAMVSGLPVITTRVRGLPEILKDGVNGYLVAPKEPEELAERIIYMLRHREVMEKMRRSNISEAGKYRWETVSLDLARHLEGLIKR